MKYNIDQKCDEDREQAAMDAELKLPQALSTDPNSLLYKPWFDRIGVKVDGIERNDVVSYNIRLNQCELLGGKKLVMVDIKPYWKFPETRQQRRTRERWEAKREA